VFYAVMAAIRLARYNVEHTDEATPYFRGIPSPGAAAVLASWVIFDQEFWHSRLEGNYQTDGLFSCLDPFRWSLLAVTVVSALLMVSTVRYPHLGNLLLGRIGFRKAILIALLLIPFILWPPQAMLIGTTGYLLYGLAGESVAMWRRWRRGRNPIEDEDEDQAEDAGLSQDKDADIGPAPGR
jgi:CDP-diacylglycerol--serine O-phosphatidyltransferase